MLFVFSAIFALISAVCSLELKTPSDWCSGTLVRIEWDHTPIDPLFFELVLLRADSDSLPLTLAVKVDTQKDFFDIVLPDILPCGPYILEAVSTTDISTIYSKTDEFSITVEFGTSDLFTPSSAMLVHSDRLRPAAVDAASSASAASESATPSPAPESLLPLASTTSNGVARGALSWIPVALGVVAIAAAGL